MKLGRVGLVVAAGVAALFYVVRPRDDGGGYDPYFRALNETLRRNGPARPVADPRSRSARPEHRGAARVDSRAEALPRRRQVAAVDPAAALHLRAGRHQPGDVVPPAVPEPGRGAAAGQPGAAREADAGPVGGAVLRRPAQQLRSRPAAAVADRHAGAARGVSRSSPSACSGACASTSRSTSVCIAAACRTPRRSSASWPRSPPIRRASSSRGSWATTRTSPRCRRGRARAPSLIQEVRAIYRGYVDYVQRALSAALERSRHAERRRQPDLSALRGRHAARRSLGRLGAGEADRLRPRHARRRTCPALFIATPVLKAGASARLPGLDWLSRLLDWWNPNLARTFFIYGGYWMARPVAPPGLHNNGLFGRSSNQEMLNGSARVELGVDDYVFLRPTQSEAVMLQFGDLLVVRGGQIVDHWPVFSSSGERKAPTSIHARGRGTSGRGCSRRRRRRAARAARAPLRGCAAARAAARRPAVTPTARGLRTIIAVPKAISRRPA